MHRLVWQSATLLREHRQVVGWVPTDRTSMKAFAQTVIKRLAPAA